MERRIKAKRVQREAALRRRRKTAALAFGGAWASVAYVEGSGYQIEALHDSKVEAEDAARRGMAKALDDRAYLARPYQAVFAAPVEEWGGAGAYQRGTAYFAAFGAGPAPRPVFLFGSSAAAALACQAAADKHQRCLAPPEKALTCLGGPVLLARAGD
jgi:hypothetical protein